MSGTITLSVESRFWCGELVDIDEDSGLGKAINMQGLIDGGVIKALEDRAKLKDELAAKLLNDASMTIEQKARAIGIPYPDASIYEAFFGKCNPKHC